MPEVTLSDIAQLKIITEDKIVYKCDNLNVIIPLVKERGDGVLPIILAKLLGDVSKKLTWYETRLKKLETPVPVPPPPTPVVTKPAV